MVKGIKSERKIKEKEKRESGSRPLLAGSGRRTRIRATLARILIQDPHSNLHLRIRVPVRPWRTDFSDFLQTFYRLFTDLPDSPASISYREDMPRCVCEEGGNLRSSKSGLKEEKLSFRPHYLFRLRISFYMSRGGGVGGPNPPYGALGSPGKYSQNLFYQN